MVNQIPDAEVLGGLHGQLSDLHKRASTLESFDGSQYGRLLEKMIVLYNNIDAKVSQSIAANSYTRAQIDSKVASPGDIAPTKVTASGPISSSSGGLSVPGTLTGLASRTNVVATGYAGAWIDQAGVIGISPSSRRFKTDIEEWEPEIDRLFELRAVLFRYNPDLFPEMTEDDPKQLGFIAEELHALGFPEFIFYDADGLIEGINYDRVVVALLKLAQWEHKRNNDRFAAIEQRLAAAGI